MTTPIVPSVTDELIAELDLCVRSCCGVELEAVDVAALLSERAELKRDAERLRELAENANQNCRSAAEYLSLYRPQLAREFLVFSDNIEAAMTP